MPAVPQMDPRDIAAEFFGGAGTVVIEARDNAGKEAPAMGRRVAQALSGARALMVTAAIGFTTLGAAQSAIAKDSSALRPLTDAQSVELVRQTIGDKMPFTLTSAEQGGVKGPSAVLVKNDSGDSSCSVSVNRLDSNAWIMANGMDKNSAERMREFTVRHEAAHCVFFSRLGVPEPGSFSLKGPSEMARGMSIGASGLVAGDQFELLDQLGKAAKGRTGVAALGDSLLLQMISEGYADAYATLSLAKSALGKARTPIEAQVGLATFDSYIDDIHNFRSSLGDSDPTHDSSALLSHIKSMVHAKALTSDGLRALQEGALSDAQMDATALRWSTGSALARSDHLSKTMLKVVMEKLPDDVAALPSEAKQDLRDLVASKPKAMAAIASGADLGIKPDDFRGGARVLADQALRSFKELAAHEPIASAAVNRSLNESAANGAQDALQAKLNSAGAMAGRMFSGVLLAAHANHSHHHDEHHRSSMRPR